jgi:hypothetical protein
MQESSKAINKNKIQSGNSIYKTRTRPSTDFKNIPLFQGSLLVRKEKAQYG